MKQSLPNEQAGWIPRQRVWNPESRMHLHVLAILALALVVTDGSAQPVKSYIAEPAAVPNVLLLLADDLTFTDLGCYGNRQVRTPNLDWLANHGLRLEHCYNSAPMCAPTRMSLYTGIHPVRNGAWPNHSRVYDWVKSMPHYLDSRGYRTAIIGKRHEAPEENFPFEFLGGRHHDGGKGNDLDIDKVRSYMEENRDRPWALVVASNQPHVPWNRGDPSAYDPDELTVPPYMVDTPRTRKALARYYAEITYMDDQMGRVLDHLEETGQSGETLVIFLSEQGSNFPYCKWTCYDTGLRSAGIIRWPGVVEAGRVTDAIVQYVDVLPTVLEVAGGRPEQRDFDGRSFLPLLRGETDKHGDYAFGLQSSKGIYYGPEAYGIRTVTDGRFRLIWNLNHENEFSNLVTRNFGPFQSWKEKGREGDPFAASRVAGYLRRPEFELYDLKHDPWALNNLAKSKDYREKRAKLKEVLKNWMQRQGDRGAETERQALKRQTEERAP